MHKFKICIELVCVLPRYYVRGKSVAILGACIQERAAVSRRLRHFPTCDTLPAGECEAAREFRAQLVAQRLSATRFRLSSRVSLKLNPAMHYCCVTVILAELVARAAFDRDGSLFGVSARRRCGPRAPGEWRARSTAPLSVAPHSKVKVSGEGRGGTFLPLSLP